MEVKDLLEYLGLDQSKVKTIEEFKTSFGSDFIKKSAIENDEEIVSKIYGKKLGTITTHVKRTAKSLGVELTPEDMKDKGVEDLIELIGDKTKSKHDSEVSELKKLADAKNNDDLVKEYKTKFEKVNEKLTDTQSLLDNLKQENEKIKKESTDAVRNFQLTSARSQIMGSAKFKKEATPLEKKGFESLFDEKYLIDLDENNVAFVKSRKDGKRPVSPKKAGEFATIEEIVAMELVENKLSDMTPPAPPRREPPVTPAGQQQQHQHQHQHQPAQFGRVIKIHPSAEANEK